MKFWTRFVVAGLALAVALSLAVSPAQAATKKKKKKKEEVVIVKHHDVVVERKHPIEGANFSGKPGYFFSDTAWTPHQGQIMGSAHLTFDSWGSALNVPIGVSYGITDKIMVNVNTAFYSFGGYNYGIYNGVGGTSGINTLNFGGKYGFGRVTKGNLDLKIAAGCDFSIGPLSNNLGPSEFGFDPYGVATLTFPDGLQFNGRLGIYISNYSVTEPVPTLTPPYYQDETVSVGISYFQCDLGAAYPFDRNLTGIAELATNGVYGFGGAGGGTPLIVGIRTGHDVQLQACGGLDLGGLVGLFVGGGVVLISQ